MKLRNQNIWTVISISILLASFNGSKALNENKKLLLDEINKNQLLTDHDPILIQGNSDFSAQASDEGWSGTGTSLDPYIIQDLNIGGTGLLLSGIYIKDTDAYFTIKNIELLGNGISFGIKLEDVVNAKIIDTSVNNY